MHSKHANVSYGRMRNIFNIGLHRAGEEHDGSERGTKWPGISFSHLSGGGFKAARGALLGSHFLFHVTGKMSFGRANELCKRCDRVPI